MAAIVDNLVDRAIAHGGRDNVSVVIAEVAA
jgi:serine/threonine protein phosphatase PrpC